MRQENIDDNILNFAQYIAPSLTPQQRMAGWFELETENRGTGDLMDLIGTLFLFDKISKANKVCKMDITCGVGDKSDLEIRVNGSFKKVNIKTSSYGPIRDGLNLYVKKEEADKDIDAYVQLFVHLNQVRDYDQEAIWPHIHVGGWIPTVSDVWQEAKNNPITIPRTNGHQGVKIPVEKLGSVDKLIQMIDDKF